MAFSEGINPQPRIEFDGKADHIAAGWREDAQRKKDAAEAKKAANEAAGERMKQRRQYFEDLLEKATGRRFDTTRQRTLPKEDVMTAFEAMSEEERLAAMNFTAGENGNGSGRGGAAAEVTASSDAAVVETEAVKRTLEYNSDNLATAIEAGEIGRTSTGLLDGVFLLGSTNSRWREETVAPALAAENIVSYNPNMSDWNPDVHPKAEALGMSEFAVLAMRIENKPGVTDGSLGSLVEVGMAAFSALINGQRVIVTFDETFEKSLREPGAIAQYEALKVKFDHLQGQYPGLLTLETCSRERYVELAKEALEAQRAAEQALQPMTPERIKRFAELRRGRLDKNRRFVIQGGSSAPFSKSLSRQFNSEQGLVQDMWGGDKHITVLNQGFIAEAWRAVDEVDQMESLTDEDKREVKMFRMQQAFIAEQGFKDRAEVVLWMVQNEAISKAAITEIGFMLLHALENGQQFNLLLEDFDADKYVQLMLKDNLEELEQLAPNDPVIEQFKRDPYSVTFNMVRKSPGLAATEHFKKADNAKRTRAIAQEQVRKIAEQVKEIAGGQSVELFSFSTDFTDYVQKNRLVLTPEAFQGREAYYANFENFKQQLRPLVEQNRGQRGKALELVAEAVKLAVNPDMEKAKGLVDHLGEVEDTSKLMRDVIAQTQNAEGEPFLSPEQMTLLVDYVARLHDYLKLLGRPDQQSLPDHEILAGHTVNEFFPDLGFSPEEVSFLVKVISNHENIFKEKGREIYAKSEDPAERAIALFSIIDCLGSAVKFDNGVVSFDQQGLDSRFTDLYVRHMDPEKSKLDQPRPEWGVSTITDFLTTLEVLEKDYNMQVAPGTRLQLIDAALEAVRQTAQADYDRKQKDFDWEAKIKAGAYKAEGKKNPLTNSELMKLKDTESELKRMRRKEEEKAA